MQHHVGTEWVCREKQEGASTLQSLTTVAERQRIDILVLGSYGRKGEKLEMLGTTSDGALRSSHASICIVRSTSTKIGNACRYTFASDGSHASGIAFSVLVHFLALPSDIINVVIVTTHDGGHDQEVADHYASVLKEANLAGSAVIKRLPATKPIHSGILDYVNEQSTDILVIGVSGYGAKKLGSVSETISREALCTTLVIKDGYQVDPRHYSHAGAATLASYDLPHGRSH
jgi:nucleotide-binding universal stress UspA family protein